MATDKELKRASGGLAFAIELDDEKKDVSLPKHLEERLAQESPRGELTREALEEKNRLAEERKKQQEEERIKKVQEHLEHVEKVVTEHKESADNTQEDKKE